MLGARGHADALGAGERGHLDRRAADRLGDRDRHLHLEVVALALEDRRLAHARDHVEVAGRPAARPRLALAGEPHAAAVAHAGRDVHPVALDLARAAAAVAGRAGVLDLRAGAAALAARLRRSRTAPATPPRRRGPGSASRPSAMVPGFAPVPRQVGQGADSGTETGTCAPSMACSNETCTSVSRSRPRSGAARATAPAGRRRRRTGRRGCRRRRRSRRGTTPGSKPPPPPPKMPPPESYSLRFSGSDRIE